MHHSKSRRMSRRPLVAPFHVSILTQHERERPTGHCARHPHSRRAPPCSLCVVKAAEYLVRLPLRRVAGVPLKPEGRVEGDRALQIRDLPGNRRDASSAM